MAQPQDLFRQEDEAFEQIEAENVEEAHLHIYEIPLDRITPNPFQGRRTFGLSDMEELAESIREQGVIVPVRVRVDPADSEQYQLVYGERRWRAARMARLATIPAEVIACNDQQMIEIGMTENLQRQDLVPLEEARYLHYLLNLVDERTGKRRYSTRTLPKRLGKPRSYLQDRLRLLELPDDVLSVLLDRPATSLRSLFEIAKLSSPQERAPLLEELRKGRLSTEEVIEVIRRIKAVLQKKVVPIQTEESTDLSFIRSFNKYDRRLEADLERFEDLVLLSQQSQNARQREQLSNRLKAAKAKLEQLEALLDKR